MKSTLPAGLAFVALAWCSTWSVAAQQKPAGAGLKGEDGRDAKAVVKDDAPTVPSNLLLNLPTLPKEVEYRIIEKHLILRDTEANIIVDYIPNAIR